MPRNFSSNIDHGDQLYDLPGTVHRTTEKAFLFSPKQDNKFRVWLPKSQCDWEAGFGVMTIPQWLIEEKELDSYV